MERNTEVGSEVTHLRSRGLIFQCLLCSVGGCQAAALDAGWRGGHGDGGGWEKRQEGGVYVCVCVCVLPVQMPADRPPCLRDTRAAGASDSSLHHPLSNSPSPPVAICEAHTHAHTHIHA